MPTIKECSRCKAVYRTNVFTEVNEQGDNVVAGTIQTPAKNIDLCDDCCYEFEKFMKNDKPVVFINPDDATCGNCGRRAIRPNPTRETMYKADYCNVLKRVTLDHERACASDGRLVGAFWKEKKEDAANSGRC